MQHALEKRSIICDWCQLLFFIKDFRFWMIAIAVSRLRAKGPNLFDLVAPASYCAMFGEYIVRAAEVTLMPDPGPKGREFNLLMADYLWHLKISQNRPTGSRQ